MLFSFFLLVHSQRKPFPLQVNKQSKVVEEAHAARSAMEAADKVSLGEAIVKEETFVVAPASYVATAYSLRGRTASGLPVAKESLLPTRVFCHSVPA